MAKRKNNNNSVWKVITLIVIVLFIIGITRLTISANDVKTDTGNLEMVMVPENIACKTINYEDFRSISIPSGIFPCAVYTNLQPLKLSVINHAKSISRKMKQSTDVLH